MSHFKGLTVNKIVHHIETKKIDSLTLAQCISTDQNYTNFPLRCDLSSQFLSIDSRCHLAVNCKNVIELPPHQQTSNIELVVFSTLKIAQLANIIEQCHLSLFALNAINTRYDTTSYRFSVTCESLSQARQSLTAIALLLNIDAALLKQAPKLSEPGLLLMDMDSTTITIECIDEIAKLAGVGDKVAALTEKAMLGELDFSQSLHQRVATLANAPVAILAEVAENLPLMTGLQKLIDELKNHQWRIAIASGGFTYFAEHLQKQFNLDAIDANVLEIKNDQLTGKVIGNVIDAQAKADCLISLAKEYQIPHHQTVAIGDGANDLMMMFSAHLGVAFHAKPIVLKKADSAINYLGLDCLLHWLA